MGIIIRVIMTAALVLGSTAAAQADILFGPAICPVRADAAFKILGARGEIDGVGSEYIWLRNNRPGWRRDRQSLLSRDGRRYDVLDISKGSAKQAICFDISDFFGKM
ncbi:hypothetical protein [Labrys neptuniae]